jgi:zinc transporter 5/7
MMFDCTALAIGLYAAVIAKWDPTKVFSYGYGRVQVLAQFLPDSHCSTPYPPQQL